jgi:CheY-like chemotaxis protein/anti-sigma regulatory factor (Ser/Thr protein kinase)
LLQLINEVLDIARIEAGHLSLSREPLEVATTLREALDLVRPLAASQNIELFNAYDGEQAEDWYVLADRQRLHQVLINLLSNAIKYNRENGSVTLRCELAESDSTRLRISVTDTGNGLSPADLEHLFMPFERLGAEHSTIEGTGIGLALCKRLVEAMEGDIGVESELQRGSTFWVELPLAQQTSMLRLESGDESSSSLSLQDALLSMRPATLLHIEDNVSNLKVVERLLVDVPHLRLLTAMQGKIGVELAKQHRPDIILLDIHLPDIQGDEVLSRLLSSALTRDIPVVILSADATEKRVQKLLQAGARNYLTKPLDIRQLLVVIEGILRERT